ncbi:hypothetical protein FRB91_007026 [Serendipita sp. 411]|nr:hypothetical protein FRB91_007026 [Serendipita sp. 411]
MTFNGIIGQTKQVRKRFDELDIRGREPQLEFTSKDAEIVNDINSVLLATSATLSDIAKEAIKTGITEQSHSLSARLSTFSNAWIRRDDGMEGLLHRLRGCGSALRMLWRLVDLFEQRNVQTQTLSKHKHAMMEKPKSEMSRRFVGKPPHHPTMWPPFGQIVRVPRVAAKSSHPLIRRKRGIHSHLQASPVV